MPVAGGGFEQSYNAQAVVDTESMLILATHVTNDKEQIELADTGYCSEKNVTACVTAKIEPLIAVKREAHHPGWQDRFSEPEPHQDLQHQPFWSGAPRGWASSQRGGHLPPSGRTAARTKRRMGAAAPLHDPGNARRARRQSQRQPACGRSLTEAPDDLLIAAYTTSRDTISASRFTGQQREAQGRGGLDMWRGGVV